MFYSKIIYLLNYSAVHTNIDSFITMSVFSQKFVIVNSNFFFLCFRIVDDQVYTGEAEDQCFLDDPFTFSSVGATTGRLTARYSDISC